ncbi:1-deoxy-D-xylulose-5-phosphate synthase [Arcanobacterium bovis]|uniref:1-deoxy-D-xylulose-5-phosphate synthase n=1 Tax=Arcanobacterium bovis TaxID=2529275 RepID=A0A4Q9V191_9ACTO|nr:1-deoxy-D-xylulose-5-phosphate synthase [Arcanobacterium bovis]TBW22856.1 1-deoxy-D-xylulose-5-phosphate synthase [Arcanobacterium bovis]
MSLLDNIHEPSDLRRLSDAQLNELATEIRQFLVENVARTGGHLGPNLGVVELTIAIHKVFSSPADAIIFDTGHQAYVHKLLTGRKDFTLLRHEGGLSGYPSRAESAHDVVENSHATTALSWADGIARGFQLSGKKNHAVAVIGDGAMTGGMAWEALNNIAEDPQRPVVIVLNDNGRSYAPTVGGIVRRLEPVRRLDAVRVHRNYEKFLGWGKRTLQRAGTPGHLAYETLHGIKRGMKDVLFDSGIFDSLGLKYIGPVNGHDIHDLNEAMQMAKNFGGPVVVHVITEKGRGYRPAEQNKDDHFHAVGKIHPETGLPIEPSRFGWTSVFAEEITEIAREDSRIVGVTAAMLLPVGLGPLQKEFPQRVIDVGIAEQHAMTMCAGLAHAGFHPVLALYATFMNRAFDQLIMDVALHGEPVTICLDRAGITGDDGASHNGMWDLAISAMVPGLTVGIPRDGDRLRELLRQSVLLDGPSLIRYPKGSLPPALPAVRQEGDVDVLFERNESGKPILAIGFGPFAHELVAAAREFEGDVVVLDPRWALPVSQTVVAMARQARAVLVVEDGLVHGGIGTEIRTALDHEGIDIPFVSHGIGKHFISHAARNKIVQSEHADAKSLLESLKAID